jgi:hypothetical protein
MLLLSPLFVAIRLQNDTVYTINYQSVQTRRCSVDGSVELARTKMDDYSPYSLPPPKNQLSLVRYRVSTHTQPCAVHVSCHSLAISA